jgi:hypothetical protein
MKTVDLRILTTEEFLRLGEISKQKVRRVPKLKVKWAFGNTQVRTNPGKNPPKFEYPKGVDLIWDPNLSEWVKLPKGYLERNFEFQNEAEKKKYQGGREVWVREKPWAFVYLTKKTRFVKRNGKKIVRSQGFALAQCSQDPLWYVLFPLEFLETGDYVLV